MGIGDTFLCIIGQYSIPILLSSGALVESLNNITVTETVKILLLTLIGSPQRAFL